MASSQVEKLKNGTDLKHELIVHRQFGNGNDNLPYKKISFKQLYDLHLKNPNRH